ncbi:MAG: zinc ABC transporter substrate-binding protein [Clostridia bacterium]|nr:zinc ABC transporter substrate-binding protein [Clostridia bacterium]
MKKLGISLIVLVVLVISVIILHNSNNEVREKSEKMDVIATIYPIYDFAKEIAGDKANVSMLLSPGVELHDYEPTPQDIIKINECDLFLYLGEELEPWAETVISGIDNRENLKDISENIELIEAEEHDEHGDHEEHSKYDTHIWLDPTKSIKMVENIANNLCRLDFKNKDYYKKRADDYIEKLKEMDNNFKNVILEGKRKEIAFGGPFSYTYFIKRYNLDYVTAYDSCGEESEPSVYKILEVVEKIKNDKLPVVFYKELSSGNTVKTICEETGAEALEFNSLHSITEEQLKNGDSYLNIMSRNLKNLEKALK